MICWAEQGLRHVHRRCYEIMCKPSVFEDGLNMTDNEEYACLNNQSIVVKIVVRGGNSQLARERAEAMVTCVFGCV